MECIQWTPRISYTWYVLIISRSALQSNACIASDPELHISTGLSTIATSDVSPISSDITQKSNVRSVETWIMRSLEEDNRPLLDRDAAENADLVDYSSLLHESQARHQRSLEDDVIPEKATSGRNLTWTSAYIIVISRVIGTGIFATPGIIVQSVGSIGLTVSLWILGAGISATGLAVWLEYGCMLPRSGGDKVYLEFTYRRPRFLTSTLVAAQATLLTFTTGNCVVFGEYMLFALDVEQQIWGERRLLLHFWLPSLSSMGAFLEQAFGSRIY